MPPFYSYRQIRSKLIKTVPDRQKREYNLGYLEGHGEGKPGLSSSSWRIPSGKLDEALKKLATGKESSAPAWRQINSADVSKIKQQLGNPSGPTQNRFQKPQNPNTKRF